MGEWERQREKLKGSDLMKSVKKSRMKRINNRKPAARGQKEDTKKKRGGDESCSFRGRDSN